MKTIIIIKNQYCIGLRFPSLLLLLLASNTSMASNSPALELSLPSAISQNMENDFSKEQSLLSKTLQTPQSSLSLQKIDKNMLSNFQDRYLTYHYGKYERIKADYDQGAYCITYQQEW